MVRCAYTYQCSNKGCEHRKSHERSKVSADGDYNKYANQQWCTLWGPCSDKEKTRCIDDDIILDGEFNDDGMNYSVCGTNNRWGFNNG